MLKVICGSWECQIFHMILWLQKPITHIIYVTLLLLFFHTFRHTSLCRIMIFFCSAVWLSLLTSNSTPGGFLSPVAMKVWYLFGLLGFYSCVFPGKLFCGPTSWVWARPIMYICWWFHFFIIINLLAHNLVVWVAWNLTFEPSPASLSLAGFSFPWNWM